MENVQVQTASDLFDLSMLEEMDDTEYLLEMLTILLLESPKDFKEMKEALQTGKIDVVCKKAHKLKSSAGAIQADKLAAMLDAIEVNGKSGAAAAEISALVDAAAQQYNQIEKALNIYVDELK